MFMYKVNNNVLPQYFIDMFVPNCTVHECWTVHSHNTQDNVMIFTCLIIGLFRLPIAYVSMESMSGIVFCKDIRNIKSSMLFRNKYKYCIIQR